MTRHDDPAATRSPWVTLARDRRYEDRYLGVDLDQLRHVSGREHPHVALRFKVFGVAVLPAHLFIVYIASMSAITPPVAVRARSMPSLVPCSAASSPARVTRKML